MQNRKLLMVPASVALVLSAGSSTGMAQSAPPAPMKMPAHADGMKGMPAMAAMDTMGGAHHALAMAYRENLVTFGRALRDHVAPSKAVDLDLARPAVAEMRRSFEQLQQHHKAHMAMAGEMAMGHATAGDKMTGDKMMHDKMMSDRAKSSMPSMMAAMETHLIALNEHLTALESEVAAGAPDPVKIAAHTTEILQQCASMSSMPANPMPAKTMPPKAKPHEGK